MDHRQHAERPFPNCPATNGQLTGFAGKLNRGLSNGRANYNAVYFQPEKPFTDSIDVGLHHGADASSGREATCAQELNSDEIFNGPSLRHLRLEQRERRPEVDVGHVGQLSGAVRHHPFGQLDLKSGPAFGNIIFGRPAPVPEGACCFANMGGGFFPKKDIGYKRLDVRVAKTFKMPWGHELTADFRSSTSSTG